MTTAQWIFEKTIHLMDEADDRTGKLVDSEIADFKHRTLPILNVLRVECFPYSDAHRQRAERSRGARPTAALIPDFTTPIDLDDGLCQGVLPYGLAAHLLVDESPGKASFFQQRYEELLMRYARGGPARFEAIEMPYGGIEFGQFGRWD